MCLCPQAMPYSHTQPVAVLLVLAYTMPHWATLLPPTGLAAVHRRRMTLTNSSCEDMYQWPCKFWRDPASYHRNPQRPPPLAAWTPEWRRRVYCVSLRETTRQVDVAERGCHFADFDAERREVVMTPEGVRVPHAGCWDFSRPCHQPKLLSVLQHLQTLPLAYEYFYLVDSDNDICVSLDVVSRLAHAYQPYLLLTGLGTSGWLFDRAFLRDYTTVLMANQSVPSCLFSPDELVAVRFTGCYLMSRLHLVAHSTGPGKDGLHHITKHLPRCPEMQKDGGGWSAFGCFDNRACGDLDVFPCYHDFGVLRDPEVL